MKHVLLFIALGFISLNLSAQDFTLKIPGSIKTGGKFFVKAEIKNAPGIFDNSYTIFVDCIQCPGYFTSGQIYIPKGENYGYVNLVMNAPTVPMSLKVGGLAKGLDSGDGCYNVPCACNSNMGTVHNFKTQEIPVSWGIE